MQAEDQQETRRAQVTREAREAFGAGRMITL